MKRKRTTPTPTTTTLKTFFSPSPSSITKIKLLPCPICNLKFDEGNVLEEHITHCIEKAEKKALHINNDNNNTNNAFSILINASKKLTIPTLIFILDLIDNKIICSIDHHHHQNDRYTSKEYYNESFILANFPNKDKKMKVRIHLSSNIKTVSSSIPSIKNQTDNDNNIHPSVIKSMLQKGVRRGFLKEVIKLCNFLALLSLEDFIRRIPIIILEDVILHPAYPILIWTMLAQSKSYKVPSFLMKICILVIAECTCCNERDIYPPSESDNDNTNNDDNDNTNNDDISNNNTNNDDVKNDINSEEKLDVSSRDKDHDSNDNNNNDDDDDNDKNDNNNNNDNNEDITVFESIMQLSNNSQKTVLFSMLFRVCYGGMKGDMTMLQDYVHLWLHRFNNTISNNTNNHTNLVMSCYLHDQYLIEFGNSGLVALFPSFNNDSNNDGSIMLLQNLSDIIKNDIKIFNNDKISKDLLISTEDNNNNNNNNNNNDVNNDKNKHDDSILKLNNVNDLIIFGIDNHCDSGLIPYIQSFKREEITDGLADAQSEFSNADAIKECLWLFRSSINSRKIYNELTDTDTKGQKQYNQEQFLKKKKMVWLWKMITPYINTYCETRLRLLWKKIEKLII